MFDIKLKINNIEVINIEKDDICEIYNWYKKESISLYESNKDEVNENEFHDRFIEYYLSECEFFAKITLCGELIGMLKGSIEFKNPNNVWFRYLLISSKYRNKEIGSSVIKSAIKYFNSNYGIYNFYIKLREDEKRSLSFWRKNGFEISKPAQLQRNIKYVILRKEYKIANL